MTGTCEDGKAQGRCRIRRGLSTQGGWLGSRQELRRGRLAGGWVGGGGGGLPHLLGSSRHGSSSAVSRW